MPAPTAAAGLASLLPSWLPQPSLVEDAIAEAELAPSLVSVVPTFARRVAMNPVRTSAYRASVVGAAGSGEAPARGQSEVSPSHEPLGNRGRSTSFRPWMRDDQGWDD